MSDQYISIKDRVIRYKATISPGSYINITATFTDDDVNPVHIVFEHHHSKGIFDRIKESFLTLLGYGVSVTIHLDNEVYEELKSDAQRRIFQSRIP